ncbi:MAG: hypothetical protein A2V60_00825 [Candidatus Portnoybacteria bacterium RIFCSPHIGHO2_01_FULL_39_19]|nr:MAG: hypothetical protein A2V60_00825 [Candidatus Portnoybacteria bacterium RIFCSPHIGHO2_01_FULL_39_19]
MQFQVPQFTEIEDKIIGPFTLKQFLYLLAGGVVIFILYKMFNLFVTIVVGTPIAAIVVALAFIKINNQPFINAVRNVMGFLRKPDFYVWKKPITRKEKEEAPQIIEKLPAGKSRLIKKESLQDISWKIEVEK